MYFIFSDWWTRCHRGQKAHIYTTSIYLTFGPQISLYFHPSPRCTTDRLALRTKIHIFTADIYVTIGPQCTIYFQTAGPEAVEDKRPTFTLEVYIWPLALKLVYIFIHLQAAQQWSAGSEDKDPHFHCRYICDHWPSMYFIFSDCWTRCRRGQKAYIYTTRIYQTNGPQISLYFHPSSSCTTDRLALRTKIHIFTADIYMWPLALNVLYIFRLLDQKP